MAIYDRNRLLKDYTLYNPNLVQYTGTYTYFFKILTLVDYKMLIAVISKL